jgi:hypothetical protein
VSAARGSRSSGGSAEREAMLGWVARLWQAAVDHVEILLVAALLLAGGAFVAWEFHVAPAPSASVLRQVACSNPLARPAPACGTLGKASG